MDIASLMWDETGRDLDHERRELARTAALNDAERMVGQFLYQAANDVDLVNRFALADSQLQAVASLRGYPLQDLTGDLTERWQLLSQTRTATAQKTAARRQVTAAQEQAMDTVAARLAAVAARQNPGVPMVECLKLATEAVRVHADAYPLAYESWGGTHDGPVTNRAKNFTPGQLPKALPESASGPAADPGANGGSGTFDEVNKRLDGLEEGLGSAASLDPTVAGFYQRLKDWWHGGEEAQHTPAPSAPAPAAHEERAPYMTPGNNAASDHVDDAVTRHHDEQGRREFNDIMNRLNGDQAEMNHKWDTPRADRFESPADTEQRTKYLQQAHDRRTDDMEHSLDELGHTPSRLPFSHAEPGERGTGEPPVRSVVTDFSHPDSGAPAGGQQSLPTDPAEHAFSHRASLQHSLFE
jgi:hypothetical protein